MKKLVFVVLVALFVATSVQTPIGPAFAQDGVPPQEYQVLVEQYDLKLIGLADVPAGVELLVANSPEELAVLLNAASATSSDYNSSLSDQAPATQPMTLDAVGIVTRE